MEFINHASTRRRMCLSAVDNCSLCYLSDHAEAIKDLPLEEI